jgi:hypothetical protein
VAALTVCAFIAIVSNARAQDIEPRAYSNAPVGVNFLIAGYAQTQGGLVFDPSLPVTDPNLKTSTALLAYIRALDFWGKSGKVSLVLPYVWLSGSADFEGQPVQRVVNGFGDSFFRVSIDLLGAPALTLKEFKNYKQDWIVGVSAQVSAPTGVYDGSRLLNIGTDRWSIRPEMGVSKAVGNLTLEITAGTTFYTDNKNFFGERIRSQNPIYSSQGHAIYSFPHDIWASLDATYFTGGQSTLNGISTNDRQQNWRSGLTLALPVDTRNSIKIYASKGVSARTGNNFNLIGIAWQYRWGGGL